MEHNTDLIDKRKAKLQKARGFRILLNAKKLTRRVHREVWSTNVHRIKDVDVTGANVQDTHENWYPTKDVLPTDTEIPEAAMEQGEAPGRAGGRGRASAAHADVEALIRGGRAERSEERDDSALEGIL